MARSRPLACLGRQSPLARLPACRDPPPRLHPAVQRHRARIPHRPERRRGERRDLPELAAREDAARRIRKPLVDEELELARSLEHAARAPVRKSVGEVVSGERPGAHLAHERQRGQERAMAALDGEIDEQRRSQAPLARAKVTQRRTRGAHRQRRPVVLGGQQVHAVGRFGGLAVDPFEATARVALEAEIPLPQPGQLGLCGAGMGECDIPMVETVPDETGTVETSFGGAAGAVGDM